MKKLTLKRIALRETYTIGKLFIDNIYFCDVLEDKVRDNNKDGDLDEADETKIWGETAIPYGSYKIIMMMSPKFKKILPRLLNVKGFEGILIHPGNTAENTHGCLLVGKNNIIGKVTESTATFDKLMKIIEKETNLTIEII
ncbi:MAG: DUF5675 family protein [Bacteroidota bacterium]